MQNHWIECSIQTDKQVCTGTHASNQHTIANLSYLFFLAPRFSCCVLGWIGSSEKKVTLKLIIAQGRPVERLEFPWFLYKIALFLEQRYFGHCSIFRTFFDLCPRCTLDAKSLIRFIFFSYIKRTDWIRFVWFDLYWYSPLLCNSFAERTNSWLCVQHINRVSHNFNLFASPGIAAFCATLNVNRTFNWVE